MSATRSIAYALAAWAAGDWPAFKSGPNSGTPYSIKHRSSPAKRAKLRRRVGR